MLLMEHEIQKFTSIKNKEITRFNSKGKSRALLGTLLFATAKSIPLHFQKYIQASKFR